MKEFLEWERQSTVLPLMLCMDSWMEPTRRRFGIAWPDTYIKFENDVVSWYTKMPGLHEFGQMVIDDHMKEGNLAKFQIEVGDLAKKLDALIDDFGKADFSAMADAELLKYYERARIGMVEWFVPGAVCEPVGIRGEYLLIELLKNAPNPQKELSALTTATRKSFSRRESEEMLAIAEKAKKKLDVSADLKEYAKKWFWLHNNYFKTEILGESEFKAELETVLSKYGNPGKNIEEMEITADGIAKEKKRMAVELGFDERQRRFIEILDYHAWYQDYRKEYVMKLLHCVDISLAEIASRKGVTLREIKWLLPDEVGPFFNGELDARALEERTGRSFFVWENGKFSRHNGAGARKKEAQVLMHMKSAREITEIPGNSASRGIVRGIARVTMNPHEAKDLQKGEVLVTSMTSPDFISGIKKAAAIVTNEGGILCHAAIVSREFGIPCVVGTGIATKIIKSGDLVEVDANHGVVRILKN